MENYSVYEDIASRTNGDIYIGVVGPVRTGKSTFIKRFMEELVIPSADESKRAVMTDELPQSAAGKTVMTTEPKFVPAQAATISVREGAEASVRLVDCVGFAVEGAGGFEEDGSPRLIKTPWSDQAIPFEKAAKLGTEKVIREHSTIGILMTTDGSITEIPRTAYVSAEEHAVSELKEIGKPFVILLNCREPETQEALRASLEDKYGVPVLAVNAEKLSEPEILRILQKVLFEFPVTGIDIRLPKWVQSLPESSKVVSGLLSRLRKIAPSLVKMKDCLLLENLFGEEDAFVNPDNINMELGKGRAELSVEAREGLFYEVLSEECGENIPDDFSLMRYVKSLADSKRSYDRIREAFEEAEANGYGTVAPGEEDMSLEAPKLIRKGSGYGVNFRATAPSYHIVKVEVTGEVNPIIGTQQQGEDFVREILADYEEYPEKVWATNIFGKTLRELVSEGLEEKAGAMSPDLRKKMRRTITRIVNEGRGGVICILL
ncbi:MAG TPA: stage IV sporulation protein A [Candidatus Scatosoma pullistercoris]|uniref:Stage IV sporulation protein A n=1 Tax=Candidatus Scatosoma pullistercoris TaxID=2840934 RepID=A0A9D1MDP1_9FIRM|nr:stage IV sporulation protein A [Candidatus Scatosoma pullistercoris]